LQTRSIFGSIRLKYMFSRMTPARILGLILFLAILITSFRIPRAGNQGELLVLMEPDGTGVWRDIIGAFNNRHPQTPVRLVEGPPSKDARENLYPRPFLAGGRGYDIVYWDVVWVQKSAAAGWLLDLTERLSSADRNDFLPGDIEGGTYNDRLYRIPAFTD